MCIEQYGEYATDVRVWIVKGIVEVVLLGGGMSLISVEYETTIFFIHPSTLSQGKGQSCC